jgi:hypothetical protein
MRLRGRSSSARTADCVRSRRGRGGRGGEGINSSARTCHVCADAGLRSYGRIGASEWTPSCPRGRECFSPDNFITNVIVRPSHR